jgi:S1-C subfamily serine protease
MTAATLRGGVTARQRGEARSFVAVMVVLALALAGGLLLRAGVGGAVERVDQGGLGADIPAGWLVLPPAGDRLLTAYDPLDPDLRWGVSAVATSGGGALTPEDAADRRLRDRAQLLEGFTIVSEGAGSFGSVPTYDVRYTFVDQPPGGPSIPIDVVEHYFADGAILAEERVLAVALEALPDRLEEARPAFERFVSSLAARSGATAAAVRAIPNPSDGRLALVDGGAIPRAGGLSAVGDVVQSSVQVVLTSQLDGSAETAVGSGSGTIITADGLILTNAHVAMPSAPGLGVAYTDPTPKVDPDSLVVSIIESEDEPPVPTYRASVVAVDGYLDAAVIRIDRHLDGRAIRPGQLDLPVVPIGDPDALRVGDPLTVVGFPAIGFDTVSLSAGRVSGFLGDSRIGSRAWIKTDAVVSFGNSGGLAANEAGELIGVPTWGLGEDTGGYSFIRPIDLVQPLIDAATSGRRTTDSPYVVPSTGRERLALDTWTDSLDACPAANRVTSYPSRTRQIVAAMEPTGFASREDIVSQWRLDGEIVYRSGRMLEPGIESGGCIFDAVYHDRGLPDGTYVIEVFAGPRLKPLLTAQTTVGAGSTGAASLSGRVLDADSGRPIAGAVMFMLRPGTDPLAWRSSPNEAQVAGYAQTVSDGSFTVMGLEAGTTYPALAVAEGYVAAHGAIGPLGDGQNQLRSPITLTRAG